MKYINLMLFVLLSSCSGTEVKRVTVDESSSRPSWVDDSRLSWEKDGKIYFKSKESVRGNQRLNGCYILAGNDNRETMLREIAEEMKGATDEAEQDISEEAEIVLAKVRSGKWEGKIYGFHDESQFFQRYQIRDEMTKDVTERIDCYSLSSVSKANLIRIKNEIMNKVATVDPRIKEAIVQKQADFFSKGPSPASVKESKAKPESAIETENIEE